MKIARLLLCLFGIVVVLLVYSHFQYRRRADVARMLSVGQRMRPGRIYFVSFSENHLDLTIGGWYPNIGHAALVTNDKSGTIKQYDYGIFSATNNAIGFLGEDKWYGVVLKKELFPDGSIVTNDAEIARRALKCLPKSYGNKVEVWATDVADIGVAERYMENFAIDRNRGSMARRCWLPGGYRCGNIVRQAFDAARGEGHVLDLLWGGFPGADAPSLGTEKTIVRIVSRAD